MKPWKLLPLAVILAVSARGQSGLFTPNLVTNAAPSNGAMLTIFEPGALRAKKVLWSTVKALATPTSFSLGGVFSKTLTTGEFLTYLGTDGTFHSLRPAVADLSDTKTGTGNIVLATSPTMTNIIVNQAANASNVFTVSRFTDTLSTGNFQLFKTAAGSTVWQVDTFGSLQAGIVPVARVAGLSTIATSGSGSDLTTGAVAAARGGSGIDSSASTGVLRVASGAWTANAGLSHLASSTSADLRGVLSDETGTGAAVFAGSPTFTGTAAGSFSGPLAGNATTATQLAANGANCSAGAAPLGVDASGAVETCTTYAQIAGDLGNTGASPQVVATHLSSPLPAAQGGTGAATMTSHGVLVGSGTSPVAATTAGTAGQLLTSNGAAADPTFQTIAGLVSGLGSTTRAIVITNGTGGTAMQGSGLTISAGGSVTIPSQAAQSYAAGTLQFDSDNDSLTFFNSDSAVGLQIGQEGWLRVFNASGSTIADGLPVYVTGNNVGSGLPTIGLAKADALATSLVVGLTTESIANNAIGFVTLYGVVHGINTNGFNNGDALFLSAATAGVLTATAPSSPNYIVQTGVVTKKAASGSILVSRQPQPTNGVLTDAGVPDDITVNNTSSVTTSGAITATGHYGVTTNGTATVTCTGTGTSPAAPTVPGSDSAFIIRMFTGTGVPGSTGTCTVTYGAAYSGNQPVVVCMLVSGASNWGNDANIQLTTESLTAPIITWNNNVSGVPTLLTVSSSYKISCLVFKK